MTETDTFEDLTRYITSTDERYKTAANLAGYINGRIKGLREGEFPEQFTRLFTEIEQTKADAFQSACTELQRHAKWKSKPLLQREISEIVRKSLAEALLASLKRCLEEGTWGREE